jgi:RNA polymerase sigma factor (sigma-70 family)
VRAAELGSDGGPTDGQLLARFVEERDEAALGALVRRLGPAVLGVCRRVIGDAHLAEDAFQATFLVLVRKADQIRPREQVGAWLFGVAYRVARRARAVRYRRLAKEQPMPARSSPAAEANRETPADDLLAVLDEELAKLPEHYRAVILLCDLNGHTRKDAAERLGIPDGTLSNRLTAARKMLARRLTRRGVTLGAGGIAAVLSQAPAAARVPPALVGTTARLAVTEAGSPVTPAVSALADGEMKMILLTKLNGLLAGVALLVGVALVGAVPPAAGDDKPARKPAPALVVVAEPRLAEKPDDPPALTLIDNDGPLDDLAFSPDGKLIAAQTRIKEADGRTVRSHAVKLWEVKTGKLVRTLFEGKNVHGVAFAPDGKHVAAAVTKFDRNKALPGDVRPAFTSEVVTWNTDTGEETARLTDSTAHTLYHVAFSADGKYLAAGGALFDASSAPAGGEVTVWDAKTGKVLWSNQDHKNAVRRLAFSADGKLLATPGDDSTVRVWDSFTGKHQKTFTKDGAYFFSTAFSPDGKLLAGAGQDGAARVWDLATGDEKQVVKGGYDTGIQLVKFLPDGTLVTAGTAVKTDGSLKFWDVKTGKRLRAITDPSYALRSMDVSADGKTAAVGSFLKTLAIVPLSNGAPDELPAPPLPKGPGIVGVLKAVDEKAGKITFTTITNAGVPQDFTYALAKDAVAVREGKERKRIEFRDIAPGTKIHVYATELPNGSSGPPVLQVGVPEGGEAAPPKDK